MAILIYALCALTAGACAVALLGSYARLRHRVLFWSGLCFVALTANNLLLVLDAAVFTDTDLILWRSWCAFAAVCLLLYGLIFEEE
ncbi:MAG: DUF5985 family protein [Lysobacterales bacterium]